MLVYGGSTTLMPVLKTDLVKYLSITKKKHNDEMTAIKICSDCIIKVSNEKLELMMGKEIKKIKKAQFKRIYNIKYEI